MKTASERALAARLSEIAAIAALYWVLAHLGQVLTNPPGTVAAVWPASGLALAVILLRGARVWPGVWVGSFLSNMWGFFDPANIGTTAASVVVGSVIGAGSTLQAFAGALIIRRRTGLNNPFDSARGAFAFAGSGVLSCLVSPTIGVTSLCLGGLAPWTHYTHTWMRWWLADLAGVFILAPLLLTWSRPAVRFDQLRRVAEGLTVAILLLTATVTVFSGPLARYRLPFLLIPFVVWVAFRFGPQGVAVATLLISSVAAWTTVQGVGPFVRASTNESLLVLQIFVGITSATGLILASALGERQRLTEEKERIGSELRIASDIQRAILPRNFPAFPERKEFELFAETIPAREMGGDFYDFFPIDQERLGLVIADVSGKGVPAAIFMAVSRTMLKATAMQTPSPGECLYQVNNLLCPDNDSTMFVTVFYAILNTRTGELEYSNAGHNLPYLLSSQGSVAMLDNPGGMALGVQQDTLYNVRRIRLRPGEGLFLYTDGVTEAMDPQGNLFSDARLKQLLLRIQGGSPIDLVYETVAEVRDYAGGEPQADDITLLVLRYMPRPA
jgi:serine phosphatase RsbU (regulator of sigma subunit)